MCKKFTNIRPAVIWMLEKVGSNFPLIGDDQPIPPPPKLFKEPASTPAQVRFASRPASPTKSAVSYPASPTKRVSTSPSKNYFCSGELARALAAAASSTAGEFLSLTVRFDGII